MSGSRPVPMEAARAYAAMNAMSEVEDFAPRLAEVVARLAAARQSPGPDWWALFDLLQALKVETPEDLFDLLRVVAVGITRGALCYAAGHLELADLMVAANLWCEDVD